jgi:hypothetical protein
MSKEEMLEYINESLPNSDDSVVEQVYWFLQEVEY